MIKKLSPVLSSQCQQNCHNIPLNGLNSLANPTENKRVFCPYLPLNKKRAIWSALLPKW